MQPARLQIDILGAVPVVPLKGRAKVLRDGRRMQLSEVELHASGRSWVRASMLRIGASTRAAGVMHNTPEVAATLIEVICSERCVVTLYPYMPPERLAEDIRKLRPPVVVAGGEDWRQPEIVEAAQSIGCR